MAETSASKLSKRIQTDGVTYYKSASAPANIVTGDIWYDTNQNIMKVQVCTYFDELCAMDLLFEMKKKESIRYQTVEVTCYQIY